MKLALLASGNLGFEMLEILYRVYTIQCVLTDKKSVKIQKLCAEKELPLFIGNPTKGRCIEFVNGNSCDVLLSINYLFLIDKPLLDWPKIVSLNIHGSLLPKYRGRTPHVWAIINNEKKTGITIHKIDEGCDTGDILDQKEVLIAPNDTSTDILNKFSLNYEVLIKKSLNKILRNEELVFVTQNDDLATFFGKRTPEDGEIDWNWQKERIKNWVRAQAYPYPGAYTYYNDEKLIIDEISFSEIGFTDKIVNGTVLSVLPLNVKVVNGVIEIRKHRSENVEFIKGERLG